MMELLVQPYRLDQGDRVNQIYALLSTYPHLEWIAPNLEVADRAAYLRAQYGLKAPDALQAATAVAASATGFVSSDTDFKRIKGLDVVLLEDLLSQ
jgi:predicted nucleic acid-binding protein